MGKRCELRMAEGAYWRTLSGEQSPSDLETALQMVHALFTMRVEPVAAELETCMQCAQAPCTFCWPGLPAEGCPQCMACRGRAGDLHAVRAGPRTCLPSLCPQRAVQSACGLACSSSRLHACMHPSLPGSLLLFGSRPGRLAAHSAAVSARKMSAARRQKHDIAFCVCLIRYLREVVLAQLREPSRRFRTRVRQARLNWLCFDLPLPLFVKDHCPVLARSPLAAHAMSLWSRRVVEGVMAISECVKFGMP